MRRATQKDVAELAQVSQTAVSMVLSSGECSSIPPETVERIKQAVRSLGYTPNRFAQALKTNRTMTIACIVPDISNPFYPSLMRGVQTVMERHDYDVIAINTDGSADREHHFLSWLKQGRVDGVIGVFWTLRVPDFAPLISVGLPIVRVESSRKSGGSLAIDDIYVDGKSAAHDATRYLIKKGHTRICMIAGSGGPQAVRIGGYEQALLEAGLPSQIFVDDQFNEEGGYLATTALLEGTSRPTAIFAANDLMAIGCIQAIRDRGLSVPGDIAVLGFDDITAARLVTPPLTTVAQFQNAIGTEAATILLARLTGATKGPGTVREMPFQLVERGSA